MSASTVSITANPSTTARRRAVEKKPVEFTDTNHNFSTAAAAAAAAAATAVDNARLTIDDADTTRDAVVHVKKTLQSSVATRRQSNTGAKKSGSKLRWKTIVRIFVKNFLLLAVLLACVMIVRELVVGLGFGSRNKVTSGEDVQKFVESMTKTMKMMQIQVDVIDKKIGEEVGKVKYEVNEKLEGKSIEFEDKLKKLDGRTVDLEQSAGELGEKMEKLLSKDELSEFLEEFRKSKTNDLLNLDEIRIFAKGIVEREIEKHAADGIGRVDYALASSGAMVVKHSEAFNGGKGISSILLANRLQVHKDAEKMLRPSFGEPGQCFALKGSAGFVDIKLRTFIIPEAVTLEHVAEAVAYDRSSAPKDCKVSGWLQQQDLSDPVADPENIALLTEFTYKLDTSNIQTFDVVDSARSNTVDTIRFEFTSNHGSSTHTCIYRLRVHGQEPTYVSIVNTES